MMAMGFVDYEEDGYVGIMTINRPQALNALNKDVLKDIEAAFDAVDLSRIRTIILTGAGEKSFVAEPISRDEHDDKGGGRSIWQIRQ